ARWSLRWDTSYERLASHEHSHDRLLNVEAILRLVPYPALRPVDHVGGHFLAAVRRKAVQEDRVARRALHHRLIHGVAGQVPLALLLLALLPHARPHVRVDDVGALDRLLGIT